MSKDIIIFVNAARPQTVKALEEFKQSTGREFTPLILVDEHIKESIFERNLQHKVTDDIQHITADFDSPKSIRHALKPYMDRIFAITSQYENSVHELRKLIPYVPNLPMPTEKSLEWATEKKLMRDLLESHDPTLVPQYIEVTDYNDETIDTIEATIPYPVIVKPSSLEGSLLVTKIENRKELKDTLKRTFEQIQLAYSKWIKRQTPRVLVEEFMVGDMYSVDAYVAHDGTCRHTPPVRVVTGYKRGYDDFFGYMQHAPAGLSDDEVQKAHATTDAACKALGLRSVIAHVELMRTATAWKIVELGPRIGGYRHDIYNMAYGINHIMNDVLIRAGEEPIIPKEAIGHCAYFDIFPRQEGIIEAFEGLDEVKQLPSFYDVTETVPIGEFAHFAKHNGDPPLTLIFRHKDEAQFTADVEKMEEILKIKVKAKEQVEAS